MPLPLIAIGIGIGAAGAAGTVAAWAKMRRDRKRYEQRRTQYKARRRSYEDFVREVNAELWDLHLQRVAALDTLKKAADFLKRANVKDRSWNPNFGITAEQFAELKDVVVTLRNLAAGAAGGVVGGAGLGAAASAGAYAAASIYGVASTGAAISGLAGIAARNAALAWLGGGALAAGGGGMAAGTLLLVNIALAPLAILPAVIAGIQAWKQKGKIEEAIAEMEVAESKMGKHRAELTAVRNRTREVSKALGNIHRALEDALRLASLDDLKDVHRVYLAAKALAELLDMDAAPKQLPEG